MEDISINFETRVSSYLNYLISVKETRTYSEIADKCDIKPPGKIRKISRILLKITENDIIDKKPIRSAVIVSKINLRPQCKADYHRWKINGTSNFVKCTCKLCWTNPARAN